MKSETYIKDSQDFIMKTSKIKVDKSFHLFSCDFDSLYTNIIHEECLILIIEFLNRENFSNLDINIEAIKAFLEFILKNNYFSFNGVFYLQILGIAMGSACGPSIANLFVYILEKRWLTIHRPIVYFRFIDDILLILKNFGDIFSLVNSFGSLKLNYVSNKHVNFLDLEIWIDELTSTLCFKTYYKPTNTFCYLHISSNHLPHIFKNIIKSLLIRIRRICTFYKDYMIFASRLTFNLISRGYDKKIIDKIFTMVSFLDRKSLLVYKNRDRMILKNTILFNNNFDVKVENFKEIAINSFDYVKSIKTDLKDHKLRIINKMQNNIKSLFVHNFKTPFFYKKCYKKCNKNCSVCKVTNTSSFILLNDNYFLPIFDNCNCKSKDVVYIISCKLCKSYYIGETQDFYKRVQNHLTSIRKYKPFETNKCVAIHFNTRPHDYKLHLNFFILHINQECSDWRRNSELFYIYLFKRLGLSLINDDIPKLKFNYFCLEYNENYE